MSETKNSYSRSNVVQGLGSLDLEGIKNPKFSVTIELTHAELKVWERYLLVTQSTNKSAVQRLVKQLVRGMGG